MRPLERGSAEERRTHMAKGCLYCGLQLPDTADFCPQCGRPIERGSGIGRIPESEFDYLSKEMKGKDDLLQHQEFYSDCSGPRAHLEEDAHPGNYTKCGARLASRDRNTTASVEKIESIAEEYVGEYSLT
jgi:zinc ribbon protein